MTTPLKPFFYFESLKLWEKIVIGIYAFITLALGVMYYFQDEAGKRNILLIYSTGGQLLIIFFLYTSLRNLLSYLIWCFFGVFNWLIYFLVRGDKDLQMGRGNAANGLKYTILLLIIFQGLRLLSRSIQGREYLFPARGEMFEQKKPTFLDYILGFSFFILWDTFMLFAFKKT